MSDGWSSLFAPAPEPATELGRYRVLGPHAGVRVSPLFLGAMSIGTAWDGFMGALNEEDSFKLLDAFAEAGGNAIDTANNYQNEQSETILGNWMRARQNRDQIVLATKFTTDFRSYADGKGKVPNATGNSAKSLHTSVHASLRKLQTDYIDILYLHWWDHTVSIEEIVDSLDILVKQGKVLYLGVSDTPAWVVSAANTYAKAHGKTPFSVYQGRWNVMIRDFERDILPMARHFGLALCPWDVLGGGKFKTAAQIEERKAEGGGLRGGAEQTEDEAKISAALEKVAGEVGVESLTAVAIAYVTSKYPYVYPLIGGRRIEHLQQNIEALKIRLTQQQVDYLESVVPFEPGFPLNFIGKSAKENFLLNANAQLAIVDPPKPIQLKEDD